jgi:hypothetical protein
MIDQRQRIGRWPVAAPCQMLVRPRQHEPAAVANGGCGPLDRLRPWRRKISLIETQLSKINIFRNLLPTGCYRLDRLD